MVNGPFLNTEAPLPLCFSHAVCLRPPPLQLTQIAQSFCSAAEGMNELSVWGGVEVEAVALVVEREVGCG